MTFTKPNIDPNAKVGLRIKLINMKDDTDPIDDDMEGEIQHIDSLGTIHVKWDDGRMLGLIPGLDEYLLYPPKHQQIYDIDDLFEGELKPTLSGSKSTKAGKNVSKNFKSSKIKGIKLEDTIKGGKADKLTISGLAKKHKVSVDDIKKELKVGIKIELEHTDDKGVATEIAMDHISEFPDYYTNKKYGVLKSEKGLEKVHEGIFGNMFGGKNKDDQYDLNVFANDLKRVVDTIKTGEYRQIETIRKMIDNFRDKYSEHSRIGEVVKSLYHDLNQIGEIEETTGTGGGVSTGAFVGKLENRIIKKKNILEITTTKNTDKTDGSGALDDKSFVDIDGDGWDFDEKSFWEGGEIVDILAKKSNVNWKDSNLVVTSETFNNMLNNLILEVGDDKIHTKKWDRCVEKVKKNSPDVDPYAVCTKSIGYEGSIKKKHRKQEEKEIELDETTTFSSVWGVNGPPVTPAFAAKKGNHIPSKKPIWKGGKIIQKIESDGVLNETNNIKWVTGGKFVKIKDKCTKYDNQEWCDAGNASDPLELSDTTFENISEVSKKLGVSEKVIIERIKNKLNTSK